MSVADIIALIGATGGLLGGGAALSALAAIGAADSAYVTRLWRPADLINREGVEWERCS